MLRITPLLILICLFQNVFGQREERLPADLRQHNLTVYNASLFNAAFSLNRNNAESVALWTRWQWQSIDADPTTIFFNYTRKFSQNSAASAAFFQQNTGVFFNTGGALNYAHKFDLNELVKLSVGANIFAFKQELADDRQIVDPNFPLPLESTGDDFIVQMAPGVSLSVERLTLGLASENLIDYNFNEKEGNTAKEDKIFMGLLSYDIPVSLGSMVNSYVRPTMYLRTIPGQSNQVGFYGLLNTDKYWGQLGYNNFYGYGIGAGATLFKHLSIGALVEVGSSSSITKDSSFELMAAYLIGKPEQRNKLADLGDEQEENELLNLEVEENKEEKVQEELEKAEQLANKDKANKKEARRLAREEAKLLKEKQRAVRDSIARIDKEIELAKKEEERLKAEKEKAEQEKAEAIAKAERKANRTKEDEEVDMAAEHARQARMLDSINKVKQQAALAEAKRIEEQRKRDSLAKIEMAKQEEAKKLAEVAAQKEAQPKKGEKYEEVQTEDGLEPGYYLIANVFGTKKYFDAFMNELRAKGMNPGSFVRSKNNFNYAYLARFSTMQEARAARDSNFNGQYSGNTWIFRVVGK